MEALKKVAVRIVKLLITDSFEEGSEVLIDAQWLGRIREEIEEVKKIDFLFNFFLFSFFFRLSNSKLDLPKLLSLHHKKKSQDTTIGNSSGKSILKSIS